MRILLIYVCRLFAVKDASGSLSPAAGAESRATWKHHRGGRRGYKSRLAGPQVLIGTWQACFLIVYTRTLFAGLQRSLQLRRLCCTAVVKCSGSAPTTCWLVLNSFRFFITQRAESLFAKRGNGPGRCISPTMMSSPTDVQYIMVQVFSWGGVW